MSCYAGIDIGTTNIKTGVFDQAGQLLHVIRKATPLAQNEDGSYYAPDVLSNIVLEQLSAVFSMGFELEGIGITGMAEAGLVIDREKRTPLTEIIPWFDKRTLPLAQQQTKEQEQYYFYKTGLRNSFKYGIYKYQWCLANRGLDVESTMWLSVCDYIFLQITGEVCTEATFAARTYVFDIRKRDWDMERIAALGLTRENFPKVVPSGAAAGWMRGRQIPVALCGHDHICSAYALIKEEGQICNSCGTAETYVGFLEKLPDEEMENTGLVYGPSLENEGYFGMANLSSSGQSVEFIRKHIQQQEIPIEKMNEMLQGLLAAPGEILYFPYLSGMGSPLFEAECTAAFLGLKAKHTQADLLRAVIEGIAYQSRWILEKGYSNQALQLISTGGPTASGWWMQCKADVLDKRIEVPQVREGTLAGAVQLYLIKNEKIKEPFVWPSIRFAPEAKRAEAYEGRYHKKFLPYAQVIAAFTINGEDAQQKE